jgi:hypothetical protein
VGPAAAAGGLQGRKMSTLKGHKNTDPHHQPNADEMEGAAAAEMVMMKMFQAPALSTEVVVVVVGYYYCSHNYHSLRRLKTEGVFYTQLFLFISKHHITSKSIVSIAPISIHSTVVGKNIETYTTT